MKRPLYSVLVSNAVDQKRLRGQNVEGIVCLSRSVDGTAKEKNIRAGSGVDSALINIPNRNADRGVVVGGD